MDRAPSIETQPPGADTSDGSGSGAPVARIGDRLRLLPSGPDLIHGPTPHGTRAISTAAGDHADLIRGATDSEHLFALVTKRIDDCGGDVGAGITAAARSSRRSFRCTRSTWC